MSLTVSRVSSSRYIENKRTECHFRRMAQMNISIPENLKAFVESRVADGDYASSSDYLHDLVRQDQREREALAQLQADIDLGRTSGTSGRDTK
jgi:antitoxin ParD1/3/4